MIGPSDLFLSGDSTLPLIMSSIDDFEGITANGALDQLILPPNVSTPSVIGQLPIGRQTGTYPETGF
jgi:hypothetical protein